ncbi:50S ribosomal protein L24 [Patescibacteria group bacterium]|nr:50S ribosomal protein L24 [Patescibacteria group bacterium]
MNIKKGDNVKIISGKDRGKDGKVTHVFPKLNKIVVEGINIHKKHARSKRRGEKGQIIQMPMPISVSNVMLVCSSCKKSTRTSKKTVGTRKIRICKKCSAELE